MMKNILLAISSAAILLAACNTDKKEPLNTDKQVVFTDTSAVKNVNAGTDVAATAAGAPVATVVPQPAPQVQTVTKVIKVYEKQPAVKAPVVHATPAAGTAAPAATTTTTSTEPASGTTTTTTTGTGTIPGGTTGTATSTTPAKKTGGWSGAAKDATIGGVGGAVLGGVIGKGAKGAVIGGVVGAAGGYILGRKADKKKANADTVGN